jgi:prepilin-type N-terminal cleavage/methylation domain-containing protein
MTWLAAHRAIRRRHDRPAGFKCAFTLLEVLVVVAIIALLVAVLLPTLKAARLRAKQLLCQTNLASIATAWHGYLADSKGFFLKSQTAAANESINYGGKQGKLASYQGKKPLNRYIGLDPVTNGPADIFRCPFDTGTMMAQPTCHDYYGNSYLMNHMLVGQPGLQSVPGDPCGEVMKRVSGKIAKLSTSTLSNESRLILVGDYGWYNAWNLLFPPGFHVEWHRRKMHHTIAFMDGHVKLTYIRKGMNVTDQYTVIPFRKEQAEIGQCQAEVPVP